MAKDRNIPKAQDAYKTTAYASGKEGIIHCSNHTNVHKNTIRERLRTEGYWVQAFGTTFHVY
jgi:hypothetical protein